MRKNLLFITADQFRGDALGLRGAFPVRTPNLDRLAAEGCLFDHAYCANPLCTPSRAAIMTGQQSFENGVYYNDQNWPRETPSIPQLLAENGFYCLKVGKTHFQPSHAYRGFHKIIGDYDLKDHFNKDVAESTKEGWAGVVERQYAAKREPTIMDRFEPVVHTRVGIEELRRVVSQRDCAGAEATEPFFFWLSYKQPHTPCNPPEPWRSMYDPNSIREAFRTPEELEKFSPCTLRRASYWKGMDDELRRSFIARYLGSITLLDELIGYVLTFLEENHLKENTLVVFTSDHGDNLGDHHMQQKGNFHDCSSKVPLIFRGPGIAVQRRIQNNVSLVDLMSTFLAYNNLLMADHRNAAGQPIYDQGLSTSGTNLMPLLKPDAPEGSFDSLSNRVIIAETATFGYGVMLKQGSTKINYYPQSNHWDWFETADDPNELNNLGGKERPPLTPEMEVVLERVLKGMRRHEGGSYYYEKVRPMFT